ncbi:unnamed protein product [Urochloa humidicola]
MEGVAVSPMLIVSSSHAGADAVVSDTEIPSVTSVEESDQVQIINGHAPATVLITIAAAVDTVVEEEFNNNLQPTKKHADDDDGTATQRAPAAPVSGRSPSSSTHRKRRGGSFSFSLFRAVFGSSFRRSDSMKGTSPKKKAVAAAADTPAAGGDSSPSWKSLVDGVRPLRLRGQEFEYYPPPPPLLGHGGADVYHDVLLPPPSPARSGFGFDDFDEVGGMTSRYASAQDLHQMDSGSGEEDEATPHAIDMQAEEFIAKFYEQFKSESFHGPAAASE